MRRGFWVVVYALCAGAGVGLALGCFVLGMRYERHWAMREVLVLECPRLKQDTREWLVPR